MPASRPLALVTGASSGIGRALAGLLAHDGHDLIVVARRRERLEALAAELRSAAGAQVEVVTADLTEGTDVARVAALVAAETRLSLLVNNAGFSGYGPFSEIDPDVMRGVVAIHVMTPATLIRAALPNMIARGAGAVVTVSSLLSLSGPLRGANSGATPHSAHRTLSRQIEVALFSVSATRRMSGSGRRANSWIESTAPNELMETCGSRVSSSASRAKAIEEGNATSISPRTSMPLSVVGGPSTIVARTPRDSSSSWKWW